MIPAGRRSYKTERAKRKLIAGTPLGGEIMWPGALSMMDGRFFAGAPTWKQAKDVFWRDLVTMTQPFQQSVSVSDMTIRLLNGSEICVVGLDEPARVEGQRWNGGILDEYANMKPGTFYEHLQPMTADTGAWMDFIGVPDFRGTNAREYKELYDMALSGIDPQWAAFTWKSESVLPADVIEQAKRNLPINIYRQEYEGSWETAPGRAYSEFSKPVHVRQCGVDPQRPVFIACDFNRMHHNWIVIQTKGDALASGVRVVDQVYLQNATVEMMCDALRHKFAQWGVTSVPHFYGDYSGEAKTATSSWSAWSQIRNAFPNALYHHRAQGAIADRVDAVNVALRNALGDVTIAIDPRCEQLILDLEYVALSDLYSTQKTGERTHASDALGYFLKQYRPVNERRELTAEERARVTL